MSEAPAPATPPPSFRTPRGRAIFLLACFFVVAFCLMMFSGTGLFDIASVLLVGWFRFLVRTLPKISWNWDLVGMGLFCVVLVFWFAQWLLNGITRNIAQARAVGWRWPWKWTLCGGVAVAVFFLVGMAVGGTVHQIGWIRAQTDNWYERRGEDHYDLKMVDLLMRQALLDADGDLEELRNAVRNPDDPQMAGRRSESPHYQRFHILLIVDSNRVGGAIIFHRDVRKLARHGGSYWLDEHNELFTANELPGLLEKHGAELVAL